MPCVAHIFDLDIQDNLKNFGTEPAPSEDEIFRHNDVVTGGEVKCSP